jgi:hypothetical protein
MNDIKELDKYKCRYCKKDTFTRDEVHINGFRRYACRPCETERARRYRATPNGRKRIYSAVYKSITKHRAKQTAREKLNTALRNGLVNKPSICASAPCAVTKVEAHHPDYSKPLDVVWYCRVHHRRAHREEAATFAL